MMTHCNYNYGEYPAYISSKKHGHAQVQVSSTNITANQVKLVVAAHMECFCVLLTFSQGWSKSVNIQLPAVLCAASTTPVVNQTESKLTDGFLIQ